MNASGIGRFPHAVVVALFFCTSATALAAQSAGPANKPLAVELTKDPVPARDHGHEDWRAAMARLPKPTQGCYKSTYPRIAWREVACVATKQTPFLPRQGFSTLTVGNGNDYSARVPNLITGVVGSFPIVTGVTAESGVVGGAGPNVNDAYSLQINSNRFTNAVCSAPCQAWQQAIFSNATNNGIFLQYWMLNPTTACPSGWGTYQGSCYKNSPETPVPSEPIGSLSSLVFSETVTPVQLQNQTLDQDVVILSDANNQYLVNVLDGTSRLSASWTDAEFNIVGDCCFASANFNFGSTIRTNLVVHHNSMSAPSCQIEGYTGETNNLALVNTPTLTTQFSPTLAFSQASAAGTPFCVSASGTGDTHLTTFSGVLYDFQSVGDYMLLDDGTGFQVQARQTQGPPNYTNTSVNTGFAARMANTTVSVCIAPVRVDINQQPTVLQDGQSITTADGVRISRAGSIYNMRDQGGNVVMADLGATSIDVYLGLGHTPSVVTRGLLVNPNGNLSQLQGRDGTIYSQPISFDNLYTHYGESWRLSDKEDVICKAATHPHIVPTRSFYAADLAPSVYARAHSACVTAGVKGTALLDACTLDVAVIGSDEAATPFVTEAAPAAVFQARSGTCPQPNGTRCPPE